MVTDGPVSRWNEPFYNAADERLLDSVLMQASGTGGFSARSGRRPGGGLAVTFSGLTATVQPGGGVIFDPTFAAGGPWKFALPASTSVTLAARPGAGLVRKDLIVARIYDTDSGAGSVKELKVEAVTGTASATPSKPTLPALSMEIGTVDVPPSGSVSFTPNTARTVAAGGVLPVAGTTERDALPSPHAGLTVFNEQTKRIEVYSGSSWTPAAGSEPTRLMRRTGPNDIPNANNILLGNGWEPVTGDQGNTSGIVMGGGGTFTIAESGMYWLMLRFRVPALTSGAWTVGFYHNGTDPIPASGADWYDQESRGTRLCFEAHVPLNAGDTLRPFLRQVSGSTQTVQHTDPNRIEIRRIGPV